MPKSNLIVTFINKKSIAITSFLLLLLNNSAISQDNLLKVNMSSFAIRSYAAQYEKVLNRRVSVALGGGFRPMSLIPFPKETNDLVAFVDKRVDYIDWDNTRPKESTVKGYQITPEVRIYMGKKEAPYGFYLSVYGRYNHINAIVPVEMELIYNNLPVPLRLPVDTKVNTYSAGLMLGKQFKIGNRFTLDCNLIGFSFGKLTVHGESLQNLSAFNEDFQTRLRTKVVEEFNIDEAVFGVSVNNEGIYMDALKRLNYYNIRTLGFNLGFRF
jgi:hypothetical protein